MKLFILISLFATKLFGQQYSDTIGKRGIDIYAKTSRDSLVGKPYIDFESLSLGNEKIKLSNYSGKVIVLNFWFIGCPPCLGEIPDINHVYKYYKDSGVVILSVALNSVSQLNKFNKNLEVKSLGQIEYPIIPDGQRIADKYKITGYPTTVLIDKRGFMRAYTGASGQSLKKYIQIYGDKKLSKQWKEIAKQVSNEKGLEVKDLLTGLIADLLKE